MSQSDHNKRPSSYLSNKISPNPSQFDMKECIGKEITLSQKRDLQKYFTSKENKIWCCNSNFFNAALIARFGSCLMFMSFSFISSFFLLANGVIVQMDKQKVVFLLLRFLQNFASPLDPTFVLLLIVRFTHTHTHTLPFWERCCYHCCCSCCDGSKKELT